VICKLAIRKAAVSPLSVSKTEIYKAKAIGDRFGILLFRVAAPSGRSSSHKRTGAPFPERWAGVLPGSCKEFWPVDFLQHAKMDDERLRAFFATSFCLKMQNGRTSPKKQKIELPAGNTEGKQRP
jgi:hypothetical protein